MPIKFERIKYPAQKPTASHIMWYQLKDCVVCSICRVWRNQLALHWRISLWLKWTFSSAMECINTARKYLM